MLRVSHRNVARCLLSTYSVLDTELAQERETQGPGTNFRGPLAYQTMQNLRSRGLSYKK